MSKNTYVFEFMLSFPTRLAGRKFTHKIRAMNEKEAWSRFNRWVEQGDHDEDFEIEVESIVSSTDPEWLEKHGRIVL